MTLAVTFHEVLYALAGVCFTASTVCLALAAWLDRRKARAARRRLAEQERKAAEVLYPDFHRSAGGQR